MLHHKLFMRADTAELLSREATFAPQSWNADARTFNVIFATGANVQRMDHKGAYIERLGMDQDFSGFAGAPVLNSHRRGDLDDVLGSVLSATAAGFEAHATIRMSTRPRAEAVVEDILAGHIRGVSVGYRVDEWRDTTEDGKRVRTAVRWVPVELSLVAVGADPAARIRSEQMETPTVNRAAVNVQIRSIARAASLPQEWIDQQIDADATVAEAQSNAFLAMQARTAAAASIRTATASIVGHDSTDPEWRARTIGEAIYCRMTGTVPSEAARPYAGLTMVEIARDSLRMRGLQTTGSPATILERAMLTTSDLPLIMADSVNRTMRASCAEWAEARRKANDGQGFPSETSNSIIVGAGVVAGK
jgi:HK97 family phage prohead protease